MSSTRDSGSSSYKRPAHEAPRTEGMLPYGPRRDGGFGRRGPAHPGYGAPRRFGGGCGCLSGLTALIALLVALVLFVPTTCMSYLKGKKTETTSKPSQSVVTQQFSRTREKLAEDACIESDQWIDDQAGWLDDQQVVIDAMRSFYEQTGVQPYLVIADEINGNKDYATGDADQYMRELYDELYDDDGHMILLFCEPYENEYDPYLLVGADAKSVIDTDGEDILYEAIDRWYTDKSLTDDEYFARIFIASANALMYGTSFDEFG